MGKASIGFAAVLVALAPASVAAQKFSNSYTFIQAVKTLDGAKVTELLAAPGSAIISAKDPANGNSALHIVTLERERSWLGFLLGKGARIDAQNNAGDTPLGLAAQIGWTEGVETLIARRAKVDLANSRGETPLIAAVQRRHLPVVRVLLAAGADPKRTDSVAGYSALDYAKQDRRAASILKMLQEPAARPKEAAGPKL